METCDKCGKAFPADDACVGATDEFPVVCPECSWEEFCRVPSE